jgi:HAE1 family hydrophobic/amphiphilic exporter-1
VDRDKLASYGLSYSQVEIALQSAFAARQISTIYADTNQYSVILEVLPERQQQTTDLSRIQVRSSNGSLVSLDAVASFKRQPQTLTVNHLGTLPAATISFNMRSGMALSDALKALDLNLYLIVLRAAITLKKRLEVSATDVENLFKTAVGL